MLNACQLTPFQNGIRCIPVITNGLKTYEYSNGSNYSAIDRCLARPCEQNQQCVNVYPSNYTCICLNCSLSMRKTLQIYQNTDIPYLLFFDY